MMVRLVDASLFLVFFLLLTSDCCGQSLISKLPDDGVWATYDYSVKTIRPDADSEEYSGELTIKMVGTEIKNEQPYRWIELEHRVTRGGQDYRVVDIILVPQSAIGQGTDMVSSLKKLWRYSTAQEDEEPVVYDKDSKVVQGLVAFFPKELEEIEEEEQKVIKTELGRFRCEGRSGFQLENGDDEREFEKKRLYVEFSHADSPFGSVTYKQLVNYKRNNKNVVDMVIKAMLKETGTGAVSAFPDHR